VSGRVYSLTVALGVRTSNDIFAGALIELLAGEEVVAGRTISTAPIAGEFADVQLNWSAPYAYDDATLTIRIQPSMPSAGSYLDVDNVRLSHVVAPANHFVSASCASKRNEQGADIVLLMGQSNMSGYGQGYNAAIDGPNNPRIEQWSRANTVVIASEHLEHADHFDGQFSVGMGTSFGRAYLETLPSQRKVLLVPTAYGGTGLVNGPWAVGGHLFEDAMTCMQAAIASNPGNCVVAIMWVQG